MYHATMAKTATLEDLARVSGKIVWDVDLLSLEVVRAYHASDPDKPLIYRRGDSANAEPAVPGWSVSVDEMFLYQPIVTKEEIK